MTALLLMGLVSFLGCSKAATMNCPGTIYVTVARSGDVQINGKPVAAANVESELTRLRPTAHLVMYYRESADEEPSREQWSKIASVLDDVTKLRLPISMSSKPDFSDYIDGQGSSHPRLTCET
jgi:hypothetical protein